jgi:hypothetical protein
MSTESSEVFDPARVCTRSAHCPICAAPNGCRLETGEPYKGPCWCERPTLSAAAVRRILSELPEPRCLSRTCLETIAANPEVTWDELASHGQSIAEPQPAPATGDFYLEGSLVVFTGQFHLRRGYCCESGCRHCPFDTPPRGQPEAN